MRRHIASLLRATFTASMLLMATEGAATAGPIEDAFTAYYSNDYATALKLVQPLAEQGNPDAGGLFGEMYEFGRGVPEDVSQGILALRMLGTLWRSSILAS